MKKQIVFICVLVAFALMFIAGCGDDSSDEAVKETKAKTKAAQMPTKATKETKAEAEKKDKKDKKDKVEKTKKKKKKYENVKSKLMDK